MTQVKVRDIESWVVEFHRRRARARGRSLEAELREVLRHAAEAPRAGLLDRATKRLARLHRKYGVTEDSTPGIRAERDGDDRR
jgi:plasmid stability protein